jgi:hypothetical protein
MKVTRIVPAAAVVVQIVRLGLVHAGHPRITNPPKSCLHLVT